MPFSHPKPIEFIHKKLSAPCSDNPQEMKSENFYDDVIECHDLSHDDAIRYIDGVEEFSQENAAMVNFKYVKADGETSDDDVDNETENDVPPPPPPIKKIKLLKPITAQKKPMYKAIVPKPETTYIKFSNFTGDETNEEFMAPLTVDQNNCIQIVSPISPEIVEQTTTSRVEMNKTGEEAQQRLTEHLSNICSHFSTEEFGYSVHIANQLRSLPRLEREILRNKIDNLIYESHMSVITSQSN